MAGTQTHCLLLLRQPASSLQSRSYVLSISLRELAMKKKDRLDHLRIASPCPANWEQMTGDDQVRFCDLCNLHVYNIARMTRNEAEALIADTGTRICTRLYRRTDGTVITRDCPVGLRAARRKVASVAGAVFAAVVSLCAAVLAQKPSSKDKSSCKQQVTITRKLGESASDNRGMLKGTILDPMGAVVASAKITITNQKTRESQETKSNNEGRFLMAGLAAGTYHLTIISPGFKRLEVTDVTLAAKEAVSLETALLADETTVTIGIIADAPLIDTSTPGTTIFRGDVIRRLPIPR